MSSGKIPASGAPGQSSAPQQPAARRVFNQEIGIQHPLRLLVAEDNEVSQKLVLSILARLGYQAELANNGLEALKILHEKPFDAVLMDIQMPEMDGETAARHIRMDFPPAQQPRVIAMTANTLTGDRERYLLAGMDDYIGKPIKIDELVRALQASQPLGTATAATPVVDSSEAKALPAAARTLDLSVLCEFSEAMGEGGFEMVKELAILYRKNSAALILDLKEMLDSHEFNNLQRAAHTLKGNSSQVGATRLSGLCFDLEQIAKHETPEGAQAVLEQIKAEFAKVENELEKVLQLSERTWYAFSDNIN